MGKIKIPAPAKLIIGFIFKEEQAFNKSKTLLKKHFGRIDFESRELPFCHTDYYKEELGTGLKRKFVSFAKLILPQDLARIKITTNKIEKKLSKMSRRPINIDPGYLDLAKLVLASTKDYKHRIYISRGIYAEVTLFYEKDSFGPWAWTYPDYKTGDYIEIFNRLREIYNMQLKEKK